MSSNKQTTFLWAWNHDQPTADKQMTRSRLAGLLRAWRADGFARVRATLRHQAEHVYAVRGKDGIAATVVVRRSA